MSEDEDTVGCEFCDARLKYEDAAYHGDAYLCPACDEAWRNDFKNCDHKWEPAHNEFGDPSQACSRCCGMVANEDFEEVVGQPLPANIH